MPRRNRVPESVSAPATKEQKRAAAEHLANQADLADRQIFLEHAASGLPWEVYMDRRQGNIRPIYPVEETLLTAPAFAAGLKLASLGAKGAVRGATSMVRRATDGAFDIAPRFVTGTGEPATAAAAFAKARAVHERGAKAYADMVAAGNAKMVEFPPLAIARTGTSNELIGMVRSNNMGQRSYGLGPASPLVHIGSLASEGSTGELFGNIPLAGFFTDHIAGSKYIATVRRSMLTPSGKTQTLVGYGDMGPPPLTDAFDKFTKHGTTYAQSVKDYVSAPSRRLFRLTDDGRTIVGVPGRGAVNPTDLRADPRLLDHALSGSFAEVYPAGRTPAIGRKGHLHRVVVDETTPAEQIAELTNRGVPVRVAPFPDALHANEAESMKALASPSGHLSTGFYDNLLDQDLYLNLPLLRRAGIESKGSGSFLDRKSVTGHGGMRSPGKTVQEFRDRLTRLAEKHGIYDGDMYGSATGYEGRRWELPGDYQRYADEATALRNDLLDRLGIDRGRFMEFQRRITADPSAANPKRQAFDKAIRWATEGAEFRQDAKGGDVRSDAKGGYEDRFAMSRNFLATDRVPDSIFGYPIVSRREDYTPEDIEFFRKHPEAGGYYDLGEEQEG